MAAEVHPYALTVMAAIDADIAAIDDSEFDNNLARTHAGTGRLAEKRERDQVERERAAIDEPSSAPRHRPNWCPPPQQTRPRPREPTDLTPLGKPHSGDVANIGHANNPGERGAWNRSRQEP
jgi:hypothetical protein